MKKDENPGMKENKSNGTLHNQLEENDDSEWIDERDLKKSAAN